MEGQSVSHYRILRKIGVGGMGVVYEAEDLRLNRKVALKFIHPHLITDEKFKKRFIREAQAAASLDHTNICSIYEVDEAGDGRLFIVMAYYGGDSLSNLSLGGPLSAREVFAIGASIVQGLQCAHAHGIVHRDIKPENVMITPEGRVKIVDFGLAKLTGSTRLTRSETAVGTVRFMSPEQAMGKPVDHRTDIWSLGVIMYELATGRPPFTAEFDAAVIYSILQDEPVPAHEVDGTDITEEGSRIISKCLEKDVEKRYGSAGELLGDIAGLAKERGWENPVLGSSGIRVSRPGRWRRSRGVRAAVAAALIVILGGTLATWLIRREPPVFTTGLRLAVMPLRNRTLPAHDRLALGLTEAVYRGCEHIRMRHESMWVVPMRQVRYSRPPNESAYRDAFGVNRIITGDIQLFADRQLLRLRLKDATSLETVNSVSISFNADAPATLADSLEIVLRELIGVEGISPVAGTALLPGDASAARAYLVGTGEAVDKDYDAAVRSLAVFDDGDGGFARGLAALGWALWSQYRSSGEDSLLAMAVAALGRAAGAAPEDWMILKDLGEVYRRSGYLDRAIPAYQSARELDPG